MAAEVGGDVQARLSQVRSAAESFCLVLESGQEPWAVHLSSIVRQCVALFVGMVRR